MHLKVGSVRKRLGPALLSLPLSPLPFPSAFLDFKMIYCLFLFMCLFLHVAGTAAFGGQRCQTILELESQAAVICLVLVLGNKLGSSTRAACDLDCWLILPSLSWVLEAEGD